MPFRVLATLVDKSGAKITGARWQHDCRHGSHMAGVLLALFPVLLMFNTRLAWVAMVAAIALLCQKRLSSARRVPRRRPAEAEYDASV
jgi:hypothetical protein